MAEAAQNLSLAHRQHDTWALADIEQERAIMEVQGAMVIAKRFPRDQKQALDRILNACTRQTLAEVALYEYSRGGTQITGPSIRLAEAIAQNWGNLQFGLREVEQRQGSSVVEAFAWDIETNTRQVKVFQVAHKRHTRKGTYMLEDPRDIYEMVANQGARRLRACILGVIPGDIVEAAVKQCETTLRTQEEVTPEKIKAMTEAFQAFGVTKEQIEKRIQRRMDAITPALMVNLRKIYNSLKDGMSGPEDWFEVDEKKEEKPEPGSLKDRLNQAKNQQEDPFPGVDKPFEESTPPEAPTEPQEAQEKAQGLESVPFREEWINLRAAGYSTYVFKNLERFKAADPKDQAEGREKWLKLYGETGDPWPLDPKPEEPAPPAEDLSDETLLDCPEREDSRMIARFCEECRTKDRCPSYLDYKGLPMPQDEDDDIPT